MGPVGGKFRVQPGTPYLKVQSVTAGAPGATAGLLVGDYIYGAFDQSLGVTLTNSATGGYKGAAQDFGNAIERAESGNGSLPLTVLRPGTGSLALTVALTASGGFGPAYPLGSTKFNTMYDWSAGQIHSLVTASSTGSFGYDTGWFGVILLAHPNWNDSSGSKPYRTSINKLRDRCSAWLNTLELTPLEATLMDGVTPTPGYVAPSSLETWDISASSMFLAAYRLKTGDTSVDAIVQRAAEMLANRIQDWQQPMYNGTAGPTKVGLMGHGGVEGDYPHIGYSGINIVNAHAMTAMALLKTAGATVNADKFNKSYTWMLGCMTSDGGSEDGNVGYAWKQGGYDSTGRTAGLVFAMENWGGMDATQTSNVARMKSYLVRQWQRHQVCHAYTVGGVTLYQFALPYFADREQRFLMENLKHFYQFHRNAGGTLDYFGGRGNNGGDDYLDLNRVKLINVGIAQAIASGNLPGFPAPSPSRIHASFNSPWLTWPTLAARYATITGTSANFNVDITNYLGTVLNTGDYTASWSHISGPATATFATPNAASTSVTFPAGGRYRIQLTATQGAYTVTEPIDLDVFTSATPAGYVTGQANYEVFTGITGSTVANLTSAASYPNSPAVSSTVNMLEGTYSGDNYGSRIRGYIIPPATGSYTFSISSDDSSQLKLGASEASATVICSTSLFTSQYEWTKYASQTSTAQTLTAGTPYFFEALHKEGTGGDHLAVGWKIPGMTTTEVISGKFIAIAGTGALALTQQPQSQTAAAGAAVAFSVQAAGSGPFLFQWRRNGTAYWPASTSSTLSLTNIGAGAAGNYDCIITSPNGTLTSNQATLTVTGVGVLTAGGLWRDYFANIGGSTLADLTGDTRYPNFPDSGGVITTAEGPNGLADTYGDRWTGWVKPDATGAYKFFITSDDASELWLSTTDQPAQKTKIAQVSSYTTARAWTSGGQSAFINMVAGNRYYIEVRHKEGTGGDHCAVAWQKPGASAPANNDLPIDGAYLEYLTGGIYDNVINATLSLVTPATNEVTLRPGAGLLLEVTASPPSPSATLAWTQTSGPGTTTFTHPNALATGATFSAEGSYALRCTLDNGGLPSTVDVTVNVTSTVIANWVNAGLSEPRAGSGVLNANGSVTVNGSGADIYNTSDSCHFFYKSLSGDFDVRSRVASKSLAAAYGQHAALMARESTVSNSRNIALTHESSTTVAFQYRSTAGGSTQYQSIPSISLPVWQRLVRSGGNPATGTGGQAFTGYYSTDNGATWIQRSSYTFTTAMPNSLLVGFAVSNGSSSTSGTLNTVVFDNLSGFPSSGNIGPIPNAGPDAGGVIPAAVTLAGTTSDDGLPAAMTQTWSQISGPGTVTFANAAVAATTATFNTPGTYVLRLTASDTAVTTYDEVTLTLTAASTVSVMATDAVASEAGPDSGTFTFTRSGSLSGALTVNFTLSGSATNGTDYTTLATSISMPDGAATVTLDVTPLADALAEGPETVVLTLASGAYSYDVTPATVTLGDTPHAPLWSASPISTGDAVMNVAYTGQALTVFGSDPDGPFGDTLTFSKVSGPTWLNVAENGTLSGTPLQADLGTNTFVVRATDTTGFFAEASLVILVRSNIKADNTDSLHLGTSWVGALAPSTIDVATWYGTYNTAGSLAAVLPGSAVTWKGIAIGNLTGTAAGLISIGGTAAATASGTLTLGSGGIDMSTANQNLVINSITTVFNGSQTWTVASGRNLRFGNTGTTGPNANLDGTGTLTVTGGGVVDLNQGSGSGSGLAGFSGKWIVNTGTTLRGLRNTTEAWGTNTAADTITLSGGTLADGGILSTQGNWTWNSNIFLTMDTTSVMDQQIYTGAGRSLKLNGVFSGGGNLIFKETGATNSFDNDDLGFILTGTNTLTGTLTIGGATHNGITGRLSSVRVGGLGGISTDTSAGTTGTLGTATVVNHGVLTLSHSNTWTFANAMSGAGKLRVGGAMTNSSSQDVTVSGTNSYTGGTDLANGILRVSSNNSVLGTGTVTVTGNATLATANGGAARTLANPITVNASVTATLNSSFATLTLDGLIGGTGNVATTGTGTTILTASNTYAGTTTVGTGSTLRVNGRHSGTGAVTVAGTLEGSGTLPGALSVSGTLAPGDGVGTLSTGAVTLASASRISWQAADWTGAAGTGHDCLVATSLNLTGATSIIVVVSEKSLVNFTNQAKTFPLVQTTGGVTGFSAGQFSVDATAFPTATGTWSVQLAVDGNNLLLAYSPPNSAPSFLADPIDGGSAAATVAFTGSLVARATDPDAGDSLTFAKVSGPNWLLVSSNGGLSGVPAVTDLGSNAFTVRVTDAGSLAATAGLTITVTGTPQQQWQSTTFGANASNPLVAGDHADPDFDGIENLIEYALALNPKLSSSLVAALVPDIEVVDGGKFLRLAVTKNPNATDLAFTVEVSADMSQWRTDQTFIETQSSTILKTRDTVPLGSAGKRFIRLRVVRP